MTISTLGNLHTNKMTDIEASATLETIAASGKTLYAMEVDNRSNTDPVYVKLYDLASGAVTVGTTDPHTIVKVPAATLMPHVFNGSGGLVFGTAVTMACVTDPGTGGTTSPTAAVKLSIWTN